MNRMTQALFVAGSAILSGAALGSPCAGFVDVDDTVYTGDFCTGVAWLKNRGVTQGCVGGNYCPGDAVTRIQMAAFLSRMGKALEPTLLYGQQTIANGTVFPALPFSVSTHCVRTFSIPATGGDAFPRSATLSGWVLLHPTAATHVVGAGPVYSTDSGATWSAVGDGNYFAAASTSTGEFRSIPVVSASQSVEPGQNVMFGIGIGLHAGTGGTAAPVDCVMSLRLENRNTVAPPVICDAGPHIPGCNDGHGSGPSATNATRTGEIGGNLQRR